jgi:hypothetical protein
MVRYEYLVTAKHRQSKRVITHVCFGDTKALAVDHACTAFEYTCERQPVTTRGWFIKAARTGRMEIV